MNDYLDKIEEYKNQLDILNNQFNMISGANTKDRNLDVLILRISAIEKLIDTIYLQAKVNKVIIG